MKKLSVLTEIEREHA